MLDNLFQGVFDSGAAVIAPGKFLLCVGVSLVIGVMLTAMTMWRARSSESFAVTQAVLPAAVCVVIMLVNGNLGAGVAVAGAFGLVRFRSAAGSAREIAGIFIAMTAGLAAGMGYLGYAFLIALVLGGMIMVCTAARLGERTRLASYRKLHITIPESLDYAGVFEPILQKYTTRFQLKQVKSTNMGSLFKLTYDLTLKDASLEKQLLDDLRCRNGNLEISLSYQDTESESIAL